MGGVPINTDPLAGAMRELKEETGITATSWRELLSVHISNSVTDESGVVFVAKNLTLGETEFEDTEKIELRRLPFADAIKMVMRGEITDCLSAAGILKLAILDSQNGGT